MALARIQLGAEVDIASRDELDSGLDGLYDRLTSRKAPRPFYSERVASGLMPSSGGLVLDLGRPPVSRVWNVTAITTYGSDDASTVANAKAALYFGDISNLGLSQLVIPALTVPTFLSITKGVLWVHSSASLLVNATGASAGAQIGVNVRILEWREEDITDRSGR